MKIIGNDESSIFIACQCGHMFKTPASNFDQENNSLSPIICARCNSIWHNGNTTHNQVKIIGKDGPHSIIECTCGHVFKQLSLFFDKDNRPLAQFNCPNCKREYVNREREEKSDQFATRLGLGCLGALITIVIVAVAIGAANSSTNYHTDIKDFTVKEMDDFFDWKAKEDQTEKGNEPFFK